MEQDQLKDLTEKAHEAVKDLDPDLKKIAFENILNRLLDNNLGANSPKTSSKKTSRVQKKTKIPATKSKTITTKDDETIQKMMKIDRTKYASSTESMKTALDRSLFLLKIANDELKIDGLTPTQISHVLTEKFRIKTTKNAVGMALMDAGKYVDRRPVTDGSQGYKYHLMGEGEKYVNNKIKEASADKKN